MKKFGKIFMIAAAAAMVLVSCKDPKNPTDQPTVNVAADPATLAVGATGNINLTLSAKAEKEITVTLTASSDAITLKETSLKIAAGETTATTTFDAKKEGDVTVSVASADAKAGNPAAIKVTGDNPKPNNGWFEDYCVIDYAEGSSWGSVAWVKMGDSEIEGDNTGNTSYVGKNIPLNSSVKALFQPWSELSGENTGPDDMYAIIIYADWKNVGTFTKVAEQEFAAGTEASEKSFTLEIPADAAEKGTVRVISSCTSTEGFAMSNDGCGTIESGSVFDIQFVNAK